MGEVIQFNQLTTSLKSMQSINSDERYFEGLLTVQMKDKQGEVTIVDELYKVLPIWMDRGAPISDTHSNRIIGKGINYSKTIVKNEHGEDLPAIKITGKIYKNYELDNVIWDKIKNKEYKGLSFGGATRSNRTPMKMKDGSMAYALSNLEHYEVAVCKDPAVPMAVITDYNPIAKATFNTNMRDDGKMVIRCTNMGCFVEKSDDVNKDSLIKIEDEDDKNTEVEVLDEWKNDDNDNVEKVERSKPTSQFGSDLKARKEKPAVTTSDTKYFGADGKPYKTPELAAAATPRKRRNVSAERKERQAYNAKEGVSIKDRLSMTNHADLNESQTFEEKVQALIKEGKSRESAEKIVGSFVHKEVKHEERNVGVHAEQPYAAARTAEEIMESAKNPKTTIKLTPDMKRQKSGYQTENGNDKLGGQGATEDDPKKRKEEDEEKKDDELKRRDHSDSNGDIHSMYNQNVGREASSGRKLKGDTTANQVGGVRGGLDPHFQGSGETNDINIIQEEPERDEDKGAANIKIAIYTKRVKSINYSLVKHAQIQELKKIKGKLPELGDVDTEDFDNDQTSQGQSSNQKFHNHYDPMTLDQYATSDIKGDSNKLLNVKLRKHAQIQELKKIKGRLGQSHAEQSTAARLTGHKEPDNRSSGSKWNEEWDLPNTREGIEAKRHLDDHKPAIGKNPKWTPDRPTSTLGNPTKIRNDKNEN